MDAVELAISKKGCVGQVDAEKLAERSSAATVEWLCIAVIHPNGLLIAINDYLTPITIRIIFPLLSASKGLIGIIFPVLS